MQFKAENLLSQLSKIQSHNLSLVIKCKILDKRQNKYNT